MLAAPAAPSRQPPRPDGRRYVVSAASDPTVTSRACADRLLRTEAQILLRSSFFVSNNHPSGDPEPSSEDRVLTVRLRQAGDLIGITILDHLILGDKRTHSFADQGWPE
jgi:DNA repair protein RadC